MAAQISSWRIYYADGSVYTPRNTTLANVPTDGVVGLVVFTRDGKKYRVYGADWYYIDTAKDKFGMDRGSLTDLTLKYPGSVFLRGKWTNDSAMHLCVSRMKTDAP